MLVRQDDYVLLCCFEFSRPLRVIMLYMLCCPIARTRLSVYPKDDPPFRVVMIWRSKIPSPTTTAVNVCLVCGDIPWYLTSGAQGNGPRRRGPSSVRRGDGVQQPPQLRR